MSNGLRFDVVHADEDDLQVTAALHVSELPHGLFPRLGVDFVRRWHRAHLHSPYASVLVVAGEDGPCGFALGTTDRGSNVAWILRHHRSELVAAALRVLVRRPRLAAHFLRTRGLAYARRLLTRTTKPSRVAPVGDVPEASFRPVAVLEAVVVAAQAQGHGVGSALVDAFLAAAAARGAESVDLVTKAGPAGAGQFYERGGWLRVEAHHDRDGDQVATYRIDPRVVPAR